MPDIGAPELLIILVAVLIIFGPGKLPDLGRSLGRSIRELRGAMQGEDEKPPAEPPAERHTPEA